VPHIIIIYSSSLYIRKEVIYSGRKRYEILYIDSSMINSWKNYWLWPKCKNCHSLIPGGETRQLHHSKFSKTCLALSNLQH